MPITTTYPGVYIEEVPSGVRTITGVATSIAAFLGYFSRGPMNQAVRILNFGDFERAFGGLRADSEASYAIQQFFLNGGGQAYVVRVAADVPSVPATIDILDAGGVAALTLDALATGSGGNAIRVEIDYDTTDPTAQYNLTVTDGATTETYSDLDPTTGDAAAAISGLPSVLVSVASETANRPAQTGTSGAQRSDPLGAPIINAPFEVHLNGALVGTPNWNSNATVLSSVTSHLESLIQGFVGLGAATVDAFDGFIRILPNTGDDGDVVTLVDTTGSVVADLGLTTPVENPQRLALTGGGDQAPTPSSTQLLDGGAAVVLDVAAANPGVWGDGIALSVDHDTAEPGLGTEFNLTVVEGSSTEVFRNLVMDSTSPKYAVDVVNAGSALVQLTDPAPTPGATAQPALAVATLSGGADGGLPGAADLEGSELAKTGMYALLDVDLFNILSIPDTMRLDAGSAATLASRATALAARQRAFYILDAPHPVGNPLDTPTEIEGWLATHSGLRDKNAALYYPRPEVADPLNDYRLREVAPSGTMAGVYARTDGTRGVWKAPAGTDAVLRGTQQLEYTLTDAENGVLNPLGINALRTFPVFGTVAWGARTLRGADQLASEWKYIPIRRLALFIEESLFRGTQWVVFEPNDETLWAQIRLNVGTFMHTLFRQGAFQGSSADQAYFVKCDAENNPQADIDRGIVNVAVGFAPLKPAEFVVIQIQQIAGQLDA